MLFIFFFFFKQKTAYEMRISDWSSDVCSSDLVNIPDLNLVCASHKMDVYFHSFMRLGCYLAGTYLEELSLQDILLEGFVHERKEIGRASCRERVCQYV